VALLALAYRELAQPYEGGSLSDMSLLVKMGADALDSEYELQLAQVMEHADRRLPLIADLSEVDPVRAEALLHAFAPTDGWSVADWTRWNAVEEAMEWFESMGLTANPSTATEVALAAYAMATGESLQAVKAQWAD
jgi:hypothetical protein